MHLHIFSPSSILQLFPLIALVCLPAAASDSQRPLASTTDNEAPQPISVELFSSLERMSRLVDIAYCVGSTGVSEPFSCASRCNEFPTLTLATTWNTGMLMSDSCGYIAVDHGERRPQSSARIGDSDKGNADPELDDALGEKAIIVAFRGTYSIANTVVDLSTVPQEYVPYPSPDDGTASSGPEREQPPHRCDNCTVHGGFLESWRQARKLVVPELKTLREQHPEYPVRLVGHSLGGAVALLAALELRVSLGWEDVLVTTFGEPKVGNEAMSGYVDAVFGLDGEDEKDGAALEKRQYRRVTHANDPVPLLPLTEWGYRSHGGEFFITKEALSPSVEDIVACRGGSDPECVARGDVRPEDVAEEAQVIVEEEETVEVEIDVLKVERDAEGETAQALSGERRARRQVKRWGEVPARFKLWQLFFAHRDYFWRIGLCVPGGDPANWGREKYDNGAGDNGFFQEL